MDCLGGGDNVAIIPRSIEWYERKARLLAEESVLPPRWLYISFADKKFLGGLVIQAPGFITALELARARGLNPGGNAIYVEIPEHLLPKIPDDKRNRLLNREESEGLGK